jgi:hypothetical protein
VTLRQLVAHRSGIACSYEVGDTTVDNRLYSHPDYSAGWKSKTHQQVVKEYVRAPSIPVGGNATGLLADCSDTIGVYRYENGVLPRRRRPRGEPMQLGQLRPRRQHPGPLLRRLRGQHHGRHALLQELTGHGACRRSSSAAGLRAARSSCHHEWVEGMGDVPLAAGDRHSSMS